MVVAECKTRLIGQRQHAWREAVGIETAHDVADQFFPGDCQAAAELAEMVLGQSQQGGKHRRRRAGGCTVVAVTDGGIEAGAGVFLDFLQHGKQPAKPVARVGVVGIEHGQELLLVALMETDLAVEAGLDDGGTGIRHLLFGSAAHDGLIEQGGGVKQTFENRAHHFATEVGRDVAELQDLNALLNRAVNLISDKFGYYNVGIFLVDEAGEFVQLRAASGDLGRMLLERNIRFRVGHPGIVGYVSQFGQVRVSENVQTDPLYQEETLLTGTRSEAAIPLLSRGRMIEGAGPRAVIGVLDIQSTSLNAFTADDLAVFQVLADQLGTAIQNSRLVNQLQTALKDLNLISQQQARETWQRYSTNTGGLAFVYDRTEVKPALPLDTPPLDLSENLADEPRDRLVVPIRLRDQVIGLIGLESDDPEHTWSEDEVAVLQSIAEQAALSVENARLLAETQRKALREQITGEITTRMRSSLDMETVLRTALNEIAQKLGVTQLEVQLGSQPPASDANAAGFAKRPVSPAGDGRHE